MASLTLEALKAYCLSKPGSNAGYPFDQVTLVIKVLDRMFALISEDENPLRINLKCDPDDALALRTEYPAITPGYHMNKRLWNSLIMDGSLPKSLVHELIDHSYDLVVGKMSQSKQRKLRAIKKES